MTVIAVPISDDMPGAAHRAAAVRLLGASLSVGHRYALLKVSGSCMVPLIQSGDTVIIQGVTNPPPRGAVAIARNADGLPVCHRILTTTAGGRIWLAGDAVPTKDVVELDALLGMVTAVERDGYRLDLTSVFSRFFGRSLARLHLAALADGPAATKRFGRALRLLHILERTICRPIAHLHWYLASHRVFPPGCAAQGINPPVSDGSTTPEDGDSGDAGE